ncbi:MAG: LytR/AlgR family response regulator transcription factor [Bacteroidota bacterium]
MIFLRIKSIILDSDNLSRMRLLHLILKNCPEIEILEECKTIDTAYKSITINKPHLVFIDVKESEDIGFELLKMFDIIHFKIIFISDISDYALQAFRFAATDYLIKPVKKIDLVKAVQKVQHELFLESSYQNSQVSDNSQEVPGQSFSNLVIYHRKGFDVVKLSDIIYCEANSYCTNFYISGKKIICSSRNLKYYEELLPSGQFMRVHNSFIVNIQHVEGYSNHEEILLSENLRCSLSGSHKHAFLHLFKKPE